MPEAVRDFSGQNLRGRSFKGQDLRGAKFVGADIRGADFTGANLSGADFSRAVAGFQPRTNLLYQGTTFLIMAVFFALIMAMTLMEVSRPLVDKEVFKLVMLPSLLATVIGFYAISYRIGLDTSVRFNFTILTYFLVFAVATSLIIEGFKTSISIPEAVEEAAMGISIGLFAGAVINAVFILAIGLGTIAYIGAGLGAGTGAVIGAIFVNKFCSEIHIEELIAGVALISANALAGMLLIFYARRGERKQAALIRFSFTLLRWDRTSFRDANLNEVNFNSATLQNAALRDAQLLRTRWVGAKKLLLAHRNGTILEDYTVRALLESGMLPPNKSLAGKNLKGAYLAGFDLSNLDFTEADLSEADLRGAKLSNANLTKVHAIGTLFEGADLTGACIEDWNIDHTTELKGVICRYVYMLNGQRERQPSHGEFQEGQFAALFEKVFDTVNLIFTEKGIDWQAFTQVFGQMQVAYGEHGAELAVQAIERKSDGTFIVKVKVPPETDKAVIQQEFFREYESKLALQEAKYKAQLQAKEVTIADWRERYTDMKLIANTLARNQTINIEQNLGKVEMSERKIEISGTVMGSNLNLGDISGMVTTAIGQLPATQSADEHGLKELLQQLQLAVEGDGKLREKEKALALKKVGELAEIAHHPQEKANKAQAKGVLATLGEYAKSFNEAVKFGEAVNKYAPIIWKIFESA